MHKALAFALACLSALTARAEDGRWEPGERTTSRVRGEISEPGRAGGDGVYGRFDGDLDLGFGLGIATLDDDALGAARASLHYFSTLGLYAGYADALGRDTGFERFVSFGAELRPLFIARWTEDQEQGPATLDLLVDSLALGLGAFFAEPRGGDFGTTRGLELALGAGLPLGGKASGPWLEARYVFRWANPRGDRESADHAAWFVLSWHALFLSGLPD